jgi:DNA-binding GntR family transcriptional regulator
MQSQAERLRARIEDEILSFKLKPGERLDETKLAERYGTSRTPVREALRQLSANGLVEIVPHKGAAVLKLGVKDLIEMFEVLAELEGACSKLAARSCLRSDLDAIHGRHEASRRFVELGDTFSYYQANLVFHQAIYHASRNKCLVKMTVSVFNRLAPYIRLQLEQVNRIQASFEEHESLIAAIENGQAEEADRIAQAHVLNTGVDIRRIISLLSDGAGEGLANESQITDIPRMGLGSGAQGAAPGGRLNG